MKQCSLPRTQVGNEDLFRWSRSTATGSSRPECSWNRSAASLGSARLAQTAFTDTQDGAAGEDRIPETCALAVEHVALSIISFSGEVLVQIGDARLEWGYADLLEQLPELFPWQSYKLVTAGGQVVDEKTSLRQLFDACQATDVSNPLQLTAVKSETADAHIDKGLALIEAARQLDSVMLTALVQSGVSTDSCRSALLEAIGANPSHLPNHAALNLRRLKKWRSAVKALLATRPDMNAACPNQKTFCDMLLPMALKDAALLRACLTAGLDANTKFVQDDGPLNAVIRSSGPLLYLTARAGEVSVAEELIAAGAEVDAPGSALHSECEMKHAKETSLHAACANGDVSMATLLLTNRADVNSVRRRADLEAGSIMLVKESALHVALQGKQYDLVKLLMTSRADVSCRQVCGDAQTTAQELCDGDAKLLQALILA